MIYQITTLISIKDSCISMPRISEDDFRSLELKVQAEIKKIFSHFRENLEHKTGGDSETVPRQQVRNPDLPSRSLPGEITPATAGPKKQRRAKKSLDINQILHRSAAVPKSPGTILEDDMAKIFRKKHKRGSV